nr:MFS transporter [Solirubrobacterales bacterium]
IVTLGLPSILVELETTVEGVALVLGVYTAVLAVALPFCVWIAHRRSAAWLGAWGLTLFGAASLGCGLVDDLDHLLVLRGVQAVGGAAALVAAFDLLDGGTEGPGRRLWVAASVFGTATGPALGGALTELFDWRAIFLAQLPIVIPGAIAYFAAMRGEGPLARADGGVEAGPSSRLPMRPVIALALLSAALTAVVFLVVLLLVAGWSIAPLAAALAVSVLPAAAFLSSRIGGDPETRAASGCLLVAAGIACLALLPSASPWWTVPPQILAGAGMGMALPALAGELMPERTRSDAARLLSVRHIGIAVALVLLAPVVSSSLEKTIKEARDEGTAVLLDARLDPQTKIDVAPRLFAGIEEDDPRGELERSVAEAREDLDGDDLNELNAIATQLDDIVTGAVRSAFRIAFIVTAALALAAALILLAGALSPSRGVAGGALAASIAAALIVTAGYGVAFAGSERERVRIQDPCRADRDLPGTGGIGGFFQDRALETLDEAACESGSSREELLLAIANEDLADDYERKYGEDPRSVGFLGPALGDVIFD